MGLLHSVRVRVLLTALLASHAACICNLSTNNMVRAEIHTLALSTDILFNNTTLDFSDVILTNINNSGNAVFRSRLAGSSVTPANDLAVFFDSQSGPPILLAREGDLAPGVTGAMIKSLGETCCNVMGPQINGVNESIILASIADVATGSPLGDVIYRSNNGGALQLLARTGQPVQGLPDFTFSSARQVFVEDDLSFNDAGRVAFVGFVQPIAGGPTQEAVLAIDPSDGIKRLVGVGETAPGASGATFSQFNSLDMNSLGHVLFRGQLQGAGVTNSNNSGFWASRSDATLDKLVRDGDLLPNPQDPTLPGKTYQDFNGVSTASGNGLNDHGQAPFIGWSSNPQDLLLNDPTRGLYLVLDSPPNISTVVRDFNNAGQILIGVGAGTSSTLWLVDSDGNVLLSSQSQSSGRLTEAGQIVFRPTFGELRIAASDLITRNRTIVAGPIDIDDGPGTTFKQVTNLSVLDVSPSGQIAFRAFFTDGSGGIFLVDALAVPEPTGAVLAALAMFSAVRRARNRSSRLC
jgi:hypothetical protein